LISIAEAYKSSIEEAEKENPEIELRKQAIINQLGRLDDRLKIINKNSADIEEKIYLMLREALYQLQTETQKKVYYLRF
jgi:hypothetical protein